MDDKANEGDSHLELLFEVAGVELYEIQGETKFLIDKGVLGIYRNEGQEYSNIFLLLNNFKYCIMSDFPVLSGNEGKIYILPNLKGYIGMCFPPEVSITDIEIFEILISQRADLLGWQPPPEITENENEKNPENIKEKPNNSNKGSSVGGFLLKVIDKGGDLIKAGFIQTANTLTKGIAYGGSFIKRKIKKSDNEIVINEETKRRLKLLNEASKAIVIFKNHQKRVVMDLAKEIANEIRKSRAEVVKDDKNSEQTLGGEGVEEAKMETDLNKKESPDKKNPDVLEFCLTTADKALSVYEGMMEAMETLTKGLTSAAEGIIEQKYGKDVVEVSKDSLEMANNLRGLKKNKKK